MQTPPNFPAAYLWYNTFDFRHLLFRKNIRKILGSEFKLLLMLNLGEKLNIFVNECAFYENSL